MQPVRPKSVTFAAGGVFLYGVVNLGRAAGLLHQAALLRGDGLRWELRFGFALLWALLFTATAVVLWRRRVILGQRLAYVAPGLLLLYAVYQQAQVRLLTGTPPPPLLTLFHLLMSGLTGWLLARHAAQAAAHGAAHRAAQQDDKSAETDN